MGKRLRKLRSAIIAAVLVLLAAPGSAADNVAWATVRDGGAVLLLRHATAPGVGDPPEFRLDDCATQRNLSAAGRAEAEAIGAALRGASVQVDMVFSSEWCRCLETAERLGLGPVERLALLNSTFQRPEASAAQSAALQSWIAARPAGVTTLLVTHQVIITALTGVVPRSGEVVVVGPQADGGLRLIGTIPPP